MNEVIQNFHFIRPMWFIALIPLFFALWKIKKLQVSQSGWHKFIPAHLSKVLVTGHSVEQKQHRFVHYLLTLLAITALAGPSWQKLPQPVFDVKQGSIIVMDMSYSMYSTDLPPNRLTRARYKTLDLIKELNEGDIGLIAYAGDAFTISPLTQDIKNIELLLPALSPQIMPEVGSNPLSALELANTMLINAGHHQGNIFWITDGIDEIDREDIQDWLNDKSHTLNILGVGTTQGAPIKLPSGELLKDNSGTIVIPKLPVFRLAGVAKSAGGSFEQFANDNSDIESLLKQSLLEPLDKKERQRQSQDEESETSFGDQWQEAGPYLLLVAMVIALFYFRRGVLLSVVPVLLVLTPIEKAQASIWESLWQTDNQQASKKFEAEDYQGAARQFNDPMWQGSSHYKAGDYQAAYDSFKQFNDATGYYNQGNALAKLQKLPEAIKAYEQTLELEPDHQDALKNKALLEELLKQQQEQQQNQDDKSGDPQSDQSDKSEGQGDNGEQSEQNQQSDQQQQDQQNGESSEQTSDNQSENSEQDSQQNSNSEQNGDSESEQNQQQKSQGEEQAEPESQQQEAEGESEQAQEESELQAQSAQGQQSNQPLSEEEQRQIQLLKKVTDDPYLLLRNKMSAEYQKRRQEGMTRGTKKSW